MQRELADVELADVELADVKLLMVEEGRESANSREPLRNDDN